MARDSTRDGRVVNPREEWRKTRRRGHVWLQILLGTEEQVRLAAAAARDLVAGKVVHTRELVSSLRGFIREVLDLDPVPEDLDIPNQGPSRTLGGPGGGKGKGDGEGGKKGGKEEGAGGMAMGGGFGTLPGIKWKSKPISARWALEIACEHFRSHDECWANQVGL